MHFTTIFTFIAYLCLATYHATALPVRRERTISFPLKQLRHPNRDQVSPRDLHLHHCVNAEKRMARFVGEQVPSDEQLLAKRSEVLTKRYNKAVKIPRQEGVKVVTVTETVSTLFTTSTTTIQVLPTGAAASPAADAGSAPFQATTITIESTQAPASAAPSVSAPASAKPESSAGPVSNADAKLVNLGGDVGYFAVIQVGTPARDFKVIMDSGSADFWLMSEDNCKEFVDDNNDVVLTGKGCGDHTFIGNKSSSSLNVLNPRKNVEVTYGSGHVIGQQAKDNVVMAGNELKDITFGVINLASEDFTRDGPDGLMGTARSELSSMEVPTPIQSLKDQGLISEAVTSYKISREDDNKDDGTITFGGLDTTFFDDSTLVTVPNLSNNFWIAELEKFAVNGKALSAINTTDARSTVGAILDTGSTLMLVPPEVSQQIHALIPDAQENGDEFLIPCDTDAVVTLTFGGREFDVDPRDLTFNKDPSGLCTSGIIGSDIGGGAWLLGDAFLKNVYYSHNVDTNEISLAKLK